MKPLLEICAGDIDSIRAAAEGGADRIELCSALTEGGLTPSFGQLCAALESPVPVNVLIRPRRGDFLYSPGEVEVMCRDIEEAVSLGANGVVIGALTAEGDIDLHALEAMRRAAGNAHVTFHRAFDLCRDPETALRKIIEAGCDTLLTSGLKPDALSGATEIRCLKELAQGRIAIMAGCGVTPANAAEIITAAAPDALHGTASMTVESPMRFRREEVGMGAPQDEYRRKTTSVETVRELRNIIDKTI